LVIFIELCIKTVIKLAHC